MKKGKAVSPSKKPIAQGSWVDLPKKWWETPGGRQGAARLLVLGDVSNGLEARRKREDRWNQCEELYYSRPPARPYEPYDNAADQHLPIVQPKIDTLSNLAVGTLSSASPLCNAVPIGKKDKDIQSLMKRKEEIVQAFLDDAGVVQALEGLAVIAGYTNSAHLFIDWKSGKGFYLDVKRPQEVVVWPASTIYDPADAKSVWRRFWLQRWQIEEKRASDGWLDDVPLIADDPQDSQPGMSGDVATWDGKLDTSSAVWSDVGGERIGHKATNKEDDLVELYQGSFVAPGEDGNELFWGVVEPKNMEMLYVKRLNGANGYDRHKAYKFGFKRETGFGYWARSSVADNLQEIQLCANELLSLAIDALRFGTFGQVFASGYTGNSADTRTEPGQIVMGLAIEPQGVMLPRPDMTWLLPTLQWLAQWADIVAHVTTEASGGQTKSHTTAASVNARQAGLQASVASYVGCFGASLAEVYECVEKTIAFNLKDAAATPVGMMLSLSEEDSDALLTPCVWKVAAAEPQATPQAQAQTVQQFLAPIKQAFPAAEIDDREVARAMFEMLGRAAKIDTSGFQHPTDPMELAVPLAQKFGADPRLLLQFLQSQAQRYGQQQTQMGAGLGEGGQGYPEDGGAGQGVPSDGGAVGTTGMGGEGGPSSGEDGLLGLLLGQGRS